MLPPTSSVEAGARRLQTLATGGRTPLAAGLAKAAAVLAAEKLRDPARRPLLVVVTDGRATQGHRRRPGAAPSPGWPGTAAVVVDCETGLVRLGLAAALAARLGAALVGLDELPADRPGRRPAGRRGPGGTRTGRLMPQGQPEHVPDDGLTTRERRTRPLVVVHTGTGKGKSTAAFGLALRAWNQGWPIGVFQFVKSAKWRVGEENALRTLGASGQGGTVAWHKMGEGWSWIQRHPEDHAAQAAEGWAQITPGPGRADLPLLRAGRVHLPDQVGLGRRRRR